MQWPEIKQQLKELLQSKHYNQFPLHEFFYLVKDVPDMSRYNQDERELVSLLRSGPCILEQLEQRSELSLYRLNTERLETEGVIMRCGMTPTDFMHIRGDYLEYDREASVLAAQYMLRSMEKDFSEQSVLALAEQAYDLVEGRMYENLVSIALERQYPKAYENGIDEQTLFLIRQAWVKRNDPQHGLLQHAFCTDYTLIGMGAPTHLFLPEVARALNAPYILPDHAEVANAIGALKADINAVVRVNISQRFNFESGKSYYICHSPNGSVRFEDKDEAIAYARREARQAALSEAAARGASGDLQVQTNVQKHHAISKWGTGVDMGYTAIAEVDVRL